MCGDQAISAAHASTTGNGHDRAGTHGRGVLHPAVVGSVRRHPAHPWPPIATRCGCVGLRPQPHWHTASRLDVGDIDATLVAAFLTHLETGRANSVSTRNCRLTAIHSLFRYAAWRHPEPAASIQRVLAIPAECDQQKLVCFLTRDEIDALLAAPDNGTWSVARVLRRQHTGDDHADRPDQPRHRRRHNPGAEEHDENTEHPEGAPGGRAQRRGLPAPSP